MRDNGNVFGTLSSGEDITQRKRGEEELQQSYVKLQRTLEGTVNTLVSAVKMRDPYTAGHQQRVTRLACAIAQEMGLAAQFVRYIRNAAMLHDIGKIGVPDRILKKSGQLL